MTSNNTTQDLVLNDKSLQGHIYKSDDLVIEDIETKENKERPVVKKRTSRQRKPQRQNYEFQRPAIINQEDYYQNKSKYASHRTAVAEDPTPRSYQNQPF